MTHEGKVAIVTGAGSGFGAGTARKFIEAGAQVVVAELNEDAGRKVAAELGDGALFVKADVTKEADLAASVDAAIRAFGRVDVFVNNAGYTHRAKSFADITEEEFDRVFKVNVWAPMRSIAHLLPHFEKQGGGVVINICSVGGLRPRPNLAAYSSSKGAAITLTKALAIELAPKNIRVCGINPVLGATGMLADFLGDNALERRAQFEATIPLGRFAEPADIGNAAVFLSSDAASLITGTILDVDGGRTI